MAVTISNDQFQHIAGLSHLDIKPEENFIKDQLSQAVEYVKVLDELKIDNTVPTFQVNHKKNVFRPDVVTPSLTQEEALSQAPKTKNGYFVTSATINK